MEQSLFDLINSKAAYAIITDGISYFIPGRREENPAYLYQFDDLAGKYLSHSDYGLGTGWFFDKEAIEVLKKDFEIQQVPYAEIKINTVDLHF